MMFNILLPVLNFTIFFLAIGRPVSGLTGQECYLVRTLLKLKPSVFTFLLDFHHSELSNASSELQS